MGKIFVLLFFFLSTIASVAGYLFLANLIAAGESQIADGQRRIDQGQSTVDDGVARLDAGKLRLSEGKEHYARARRNLFLVLADKLLKGGKGFREGREQIAAGGRRVAQGEQEVDVGERRLEAGKLEMSSGHDQLRLAKRIHVALLILVGVFATLTLVSWFSWRRTARRPTGP